MLGEAAFGSCAVGGLKGGDARLWTCKDSHPCMRILA